MTLADSSALSIALRRSPTAQLTEIETAVREELTALIDGQRLRIIGMVRQELLSGMRDEAMFRQLRDRLRPFDDEPCYTADHERAAEFANLCVRRSIQGTTVDMLVCAVAHRLDETILATDRDFARYAAVLPIRLHRLTPGA